MSTQTLVFTDLDGTLLDHDSYSYEAALPALAELERRGIPLILTSSKTRTEMEHIRQELGLNYPFISENGAAVYCPANSGQGDAHILARSRVDVLATLSSLRQDGFLFRGFADCDVETIAELTGLDRVAAERAAQREFTEPVEWLDTRERLQDFETRLEEHGLHLIQGGRFLSIGSPADKGQAMRWLSKRYAQHGPVSCIALGDSPNDLPMLSQAEIPVVIASHRLLELPGEHAERAVRSTLRGPAGWNEVMLALLNDHQTIITETQHG